MRFENLSTKGQFFFLLSMLGIITTYMLIVFGLIWVCENILPF